MQKILATVRYFKPEKAYYIVFPAAAATWTGRCVCCAYNDGTGAVSSLNETTAAAVRAMDAVEGERAETVLECFAHAVKRTRGHFTLRSDFVRKRKCDMRLTMVHRLDCHGEISAVLLAGF